MELLIVLWGSERGRVRVGRGRCDGGGRGGSVAGRQGEEGGGEMGRDCWGGSDEAIVESGTLTGE